MLFTVFNLVVSAQFYASLTNGTYADSKHYQFDILLKSQGGDFELTSYQCSFKFNNAITNGGTLSFSYVSSSSELNNPPSSGGCFILNTDGSPELAFGSNVGNDLISSTYKKLGKFQITNTVNFPATDPGIAWDFSGSIQTIFTGTGFSDITNDGQYINLGDPIPMPVELTSFEAINKNNKVLLKWSTATETNNYGFDIEKSNTMNSTDEPQWNKIGFVPGHGTVTSPKSYSFTDDGKNNLGKIQYRLKIIDLDGSFKYSEVCEINLKSPEKFELLSNYPNPFNPETNIGYYLKSDCSVRLKIYSVTGELVDVLVNETQASGFYKVYWHASSYPSGIYISCLEAVSSDGTENFKAFNKMLLLK